MGDSPQTRPVVPGPGQDLASSSGFVGSVCVASEQGLLMCSSLSAEITNTILSSRAPSLKWKIFVSWCSLLGLDPVHCPVGLVLDFLQSRFSVWMAPATLKVYVAANAPDLVKVLLQLRMGYIP